MPVKPAPAAARACEVLAALSRDPSRPHTLSEVARALGISRGSCQAVLVALLDAGLLLRHEPSLTYVLGPACLTIGDAARNASPVLAAAEPEMWALRDLTGLGIAGIVRRPAKAAQFELKCGVTLGMRSMPLSRAKPIRRLSRCEVLAGQECWRSWRAIVVIPGAQCTRSVIRRQFMCCTPSRRNQSAALRHHRRTWLLFASG